MKLTRGDVELAVYERGPKDAPTLVMVHGYPDDHTVWDALVKRLSTRFHVVTYDVRGAGASTAPSDRAGYRLERLSGDLRAVIEATSRGPAHVVAHDWGSIQAWELVTDADAKHLLASYTSISGPCLDHVGHWLRAGGSHGAQLLKSWYIGAFHLPVLPELMWRSGLAAKLLARLDESHVERATLGRDGTLGMELYRANMIPRLRAPRERWAQTRVQIIVPRGDKFVSREVASCAARWVTELSVNEIAGGHWVVRHDPDRIAALVTAWVDKEVTQEKVA